MKVKNFDTWTRTLAPALALSAALGAAQAAPRQMVLVIAEGVSPQTIEFGRGYLKTAYGKDQAVAFDDLKAGGKSMPGGNFAASSFKGLLKSAAASGYKTGLVTSEDALKTAALFYDTTPQEVAGVKFDIIAGGGRASAVGAAQQVKAAGGTAMLSVEALDDDVKGKTLALMADGQLSWNLDRDGEKVPGFSELVTLALQTLAADDKPFFLVIHDTLMARALNAKDTPAALEQFKELDGILGDVLGTREGVAKPASFGISVVATGGAQQPKWTTNQPNERADALYIVSALPMSYTHAGAMLKGADEAKLNHFATTKYKGWKLSDDARAGILAGRIMPESALRASYEPALKISYEAAGDGSTVWAMSAPMEGDVVQALSTVAATKPSEK